MKNEYDFDKIMDEFYELSEEEQEELLNPKNLDEYEDYQFSNRFEESVDKIIGEAEALQKADKKRKSHKNIFKISIIAFILIFAYSINTGTTYGGLMNIIKSWKEVLGGDTYVTTQSESDNNVAYKMLEPSYIPEGYKETERTEKQKSIRINYEDNNGNSIYYNYSVPTNSQMMINTENAEIENIKIKNDDIMLVYKGNNIKALLENKKYICYISMNYDKNKDENCMKHEMIKIINSIS